MPGVKDQDWSGALFVGEGEARFALRIGLLTETNKLLREKMTNNLWRIGPMAPDGSYKQVQISTDDRKIMPAHLDALREVIAHPDWWSTAEVADATAKLPVLEQQYALVQNQRHLIEVRYARTGDGDSLVGTVTAFDDNTTIVLEVSAPWTETPASHWPKTECLAPSRAWSTRTVRGISSCRRMNLPKPAAVTHRSPT